MKRDNPNVRAASMLCAAALLGALMAGGAAAEDVSPYGTLPSGVKIDPNGVLRVGWGAPPTTLDPHLVIQPTEESYNTLVYDRLTRMSADFKPEPMLATKWTFAPNESALDLDLRQDVTFHDGTRFDATSVKASLDRAKTLPRSTSAAFLTAVESVEILNAFKVRLHLVAHRGANLPYILGTAAGTIVSAKAIADTSRNLALDPGDAGSGPYLVTEFKPNERVVYERANGTPWDKGAGLVRRIEMNFMVSSARLRAFQTGALDFAQILGLEVSPARKFVAANRYQEQIETGTRQTMFLRASQPTLSDIKVRRAIASAIDRAAIDRAVFDGNCAPATQIFDKDHWAHDPGFIDFKYDPDGARAALKEAGAAGKSIEIVAGAGTQYEQVALVIQSELKDIGLDATIVPMPFGDAVAAFRTKTRDAFVFNLQAEPHPDVTYGTYFLSGYAVTPEADVPGLTALLAQAQDPQTSPEEQIKIYRKATDMVAAEATAIPICFSTNLYVNTNNVLFAQTIRRRVGGLRDLRFFAMKAK